MLEELLEKALKTADAAEVYGEESIETDIQFESGILKTADQKKSAGAGLRVIKDGRIGFASTTDANRIDDVVEQAVASAQFGDKAEFRFASQSASVNADTYDAAIEELTLEQMVDEGNKAISVLADNVPQGKTDFSITTAQSVYRVMNNTGLDAVYRATEFHEYITSVIVDGDSILWVSDGGSSGNIQMETDKYVDSITELAENAKRKAPVISGQYPVIVVYHEMPNLISSFELGVNGMHLLKGDSPLIGRIGEQVLGPVTVIDDPHIPYGIGTMPFDDEGVPSEPSVLFNNGVFENFLFDLNRAGKTGNRSTGNASRSSVHDVPTPDSTNMFLAPGTTSRSDMLKNMNEGLIVFGVLGGGQSNLLAGDFALNVMLGYYVNNGEIQGRVTDTMISGNVYDAFDENVVLGDISHMYGSYFLPDVMFNIITISS